MLLYLAMLFILVNC